ncbi:MAG: hypothetical protein AAGM67_10020, partial [Bacteroidota bacterium]
RYSLETKTSVSTRQIASAISGLVLFSSLLFTLNSNEAPLEDVFFSLSVDAEITLCDDGGTFVIEFVNGHVEPLSGQEILLGFPDGVQYVAGSLVDTSSYQVREDDISDLSLPVFTLDNVEPGGMVQFEVSYEADAAARAFILGGNTPRNFVKLSTNQGVAIDSSDAYNILYPALSILSVNPNSQLVHTGDTTTRSFQITNGGYGRLSELIVTDLHDEGINWVSANLGTLNASGDSLFLQGSDFEGVGNGDQYLDSYESVQIVQSIVAQGCQDGTVSSVLNTHWGCGETSVAGTATNAHISINLKLPNLSLSSTQSLGTCYGEGEADVHSISLENKGAGTAFEVQLNIFKSAGSGYEEDIFSKIDPNSITYQWGNNGTPQPISPAQTWPTQASGDYQCLGTDPVGKVLLDLPDIPSGERLIVNFSTQSCCIDLCQKQRNSGWKYNVTYNDACQQNPQSNTKTGQSPLDGMMAVFSESP